MSERQRSLATETELTASAPPRPGPATGSVQTYRGRRLEDILPQIREELGPDAVILREREGLVGGFGGFFAQRFIEVQARAAARRSTSTTRTSPRTTWRRRNRHRQDGASAPDVTVTPPEPAEDRGSSAAERRARRVHVCLASGGVGVDRG